MKRWPQYGYLVLAKETINHRGGHHGETLYKEAWQCHRDKQLRDPGSPGIVGSRHSRGNLELNAGRRGR